MVDNHDEEVESLRKAAIAYDKKKKDSVITTRVESDDISKLKETLT